MVGVVDVVLLTKNSQRVLEKCVESIYQNVPVGQLIVVDGYSEDKTLKILNQFNEKYHNLKIVFDRGTRATARQKGISQVGTDWFMFVDSDVVLCKDWYKKAQKYVLEDVGAVWGIEVWSTIHNPKTLKLFLMVTRKIFEVRGGTHDTLIRTDLVKDIQIPKNLHVFEDAYIKNWVTSKGYRVVACYNPFCVHYRPRSVWTLGGSLGLVAEAFSLGHPRLIGKLLLAYGFYTAYSMYQLLGRGSSRVGKGVLGVT
jgi:glycosyltransferase involved in cell wall biosynthesis